MISSSSSSSSSCHSSLLILFSISILTTITTPYTTQTLAFTPSPTIIATTRSSSTGRSSARRIPSWIIPSGSSTSSSSSSSTRRFYAHDQHNEQSPLIKSAKHRSLYFVLGVPRDASPSEIKQAFRQKAKQYHPDVLLSKNNNNKQKLLMPNTEKLIPSSLSSPSKTTETAKSNKQTKTSRAKASVGVKTTSNTTKAERQREEQKHQEQKQKQEQQLKRQQQQQQKLLQEQEQLRQQQLKQQQEEKDLITQRFQEINQAYQILSNKELRRKYDIETTGFSSVMLQEDNLEQTTENNAAGAGFAWKTPPHDSTTSNQHVTVDQFRNFDSNRPGTTTNTHMNNNPASRQRATKTTAHNNRDPTAANYGVGGFDSSVDVDSIFAYFFGYGQSEPGYYSSSEYYQANDQTKQEWPYTRYSPTNSPNGRRVVRNQSAPSSSSSWKQTHVARPERRRHYHDYSSNRDEWPYNNNQGTYQQQQQRPQPQPFAQRPWASTHVAAPGAWAMSSYDDNFYYEEDLVEDDGSVVMSGEWATQPFGGSSSTWPHNNPNLNTQQPHQYHYRQQQPARRMSTVQHHQARDSVAWPRTTTSTSSGASHFHTTPVSHSHSSASSGHHSYTTCSACRGTGRVHVPSQVPRTVWQREADPPCEVCGGSGRVSVVGQHQSYSPFATSFQQQQQQRHHYHNQQPPRQSVWVMEDQQMPNLNEEDYVYVPQRRHRQIPRHPDFGKQTFLSDWGRVEFGGQGQRYNNNFMVD